MARSSEGGVPVMPAAVRAAVDLGSSSVKLLVARREAGGALVTLEDRRVGANLGKGTGRDGRLPRENQQRALDALVTLLEVASRHGVEPVDIPLVATAAVRKAPNGEAFMARVRRGLGLARARVLSGPEEAEAGYHAALLGLPGAARGRFATLDLGGGSFQLAVGTHARMDAGASTPVGSNLVQDQLLPGAGISAAQFAAADTRLGELAPMPLPARRLAGRTLVAMGGISLFLAAQFGRPVVERVEIEHLRLRVGPLTPSRRAAVLLRGVPAARRRALGVDTAAGRHDYATKLPAKLTLLLHIMRSLDLDDLRVSTTDVRHLLVHRDFLKEATPRRR